MQDMKDMPGQVFGCIALSEDQACYIVPARSSVEDRSFIFKYRLQSIFYRLAFHRKFKGIGQFFRASIKQSNLVSRFIGQLSTSNLRRKEGIFYQSAGITICGFVYIRGVIVCSL